MMWSTRAVRVSFCAASLLGLGVAGITPAVATSGLANSFSARYPSSTTRTAAGCSNTCHGGSTSNYNAYGRDLRAASGTNDQRLAAIENLDSDKEGNSNLVEITKNAQPGWCVATAPGCDNNGSYAAIVSDPAGSGVRDEPAAGRKRWRTLYRRGQRRDQLQRRCLPRSGRQRGQLSVELRRQHHGIRCHGGACLRGSRVVHSEAHGHGQRRAHQLGIDDGPGIRRYRTAATRREPGRSVPGYDGVAGGVRRLRFLGPGRHDRQPRLDVRRWRYGLGPQADSCLQHRRHVHGDTEGHRRYGPHGNRDDDRVYPGHEFR